MDGYYQNKKNQYVIFLQDWIDQVVSNKLWKKYADLHIDEIDSELKKRETWIVGSLFLLECVTPLIYKDNLDVILAIPLTCLSKPSHTYFKELKEIEKELDLTPPSFYFFPKGEANYEKTIRSSKYLAQISGKEKAEFYYDEKKEGDEIYRTVFVKNIEK